MNVPSIVIVDNVGIANLDAIAAALTKQFTTDFPAYWNAAATVRIATSDKPAQSGEWICYVHDQPTATDPTGALAYHYTTDAGLPAMNAFNGLCTQYGDALSTVIGHEIAESLADPFLRRGVQDGNGTWFALEVADAVEGDVYAADNGVSLTNFCTPFFFEPPLLPTAGTKYDFMGLCTAPFQVRPGGYAQSWDPSKGWQQIGQCRPYRAHLASIGLGRGARRRVA